MTGNWNDSIIDEFRANGGTVHTASFGRDLVLVHHVGAKSGTSRVTPLMGLREGRDAWLIAASKAGAPENPAWYHNLLAHPDTEIETPDDGIVAVTATDLTGADRESAWAQFTDHSDGFREYQERTARTIPVLRLSRRTGTDMATHLTVTGTSWITPSLKRVHFRSDDLSAFAESPHTDRYVKIVFPKPGVVYPEPLDVRALRGTIPPEDMPDVRTYTVVALDSAAGTLAIDFVVHGDDGVAGPWAAQADAGDTLIVNGPGGAYSPDPAADWHLLVGDESAIPAISAAVDALAADAVARVVLLVEKPGYEPALALPQHGSALFLYRTDGSSESVEGLLAAAVARLEWPAGRVHAFVHGEAQEVMHGIRPLLLKERGLTRDQVSISGYWRQGRTEDSFRVWKSELAEAEG